MSNNFLDEPQNINELEGHKIAEGVNLLPFLTGENKSAPHTTLAWRFGPQKALNFDEDKNMA